MRLSDRPLRLATLAVSLTVLAACATPTSTPSVSPTASPALATPAASLAVVAPTPSPTPEASTSESTEPTEFVPPTPACPAPPNAVALPTVLVTAPNGDDIMATPGSSSVTTCSTVASTDVVPADPKSGLVVRPDDTLVLTLSPGWRFLGWSGFDHPATGDGGNVWTSVATPGGPSHIAVPVPVRPGDSVATYDLALEGLDGHAVAQYEVSVLVRVH